MTGFFLFAVIGVWVWICLRITRLLFRSYPDRPRRKWLSRSVLALLLLLPVADEIVGGFQFRALCNENAKFRLGVSNPEGRVARIVIDPSNEVVKNTAITIFHSNVSYFDVSTNEMIVVFDRYVAKGGVFIRLLGISEKNAPITMNSSFCSPTNEQGESAKDAFKFSVIN